MTDIQTQARTERSETPQRHAAPTNKSSCLTSGRFTMPPSAKPSRGISPILHPILVKAAVATRRPAVTTQFITDIFLSGCRVFNQRTTTAVLV